MAGLTARSSAARRFEKRGALRRAIETRAMLAVRSDRDREMLGQVARCNESEQSFARAGETALVAEIATSQRASKPLS
jgi:hypothetical protein